MKDKFKKLVALICCVTCLVTSLSACSTATETTEFTVDNSANHIWNVSETENYLVKNGNTDYKIVLPENASTIIKDASKELMQLMAGATGATFSTINDTETFAGGKYISLGNTSIAASADVYDVSGLGTDGYRIKTKGDNVFVIGEDYGVLYGVYGLLNELVGYEFFYKDTYSLDKKQDVKLKNYDVLDVPDIANRAAGYGTMWQQAQTLYKFRMRNYGTFFIPIRGQIFHNSHAYLPYEENSTIHSKWYNGNGSQVCYTAHGDEKEYNAMVNQTVKVLKEELINYPDRNLVTFSILDNTNSCNCEACNAMTEKYGAESAAIILFLNKVNAQIKEWFDGDGAEYSRDLKICFFAYFKYVKPPVEYDEETDEYVPVDGIRCDDGVCVMYAPIEADYTVGFDSYENESVKSAILGWRAVSNDLATWFYDTIFLSESTHFVFYNTFNGYQERIRYAYYANSQYMFLQGGNFGGQPMFKSLKMYLQSKLTWDVNDNYQALIQRFFDNFYGAASDTMMQIFDEMRARALYVKSAMNVGGDCYAQWDKAEYWPKGTLERWHSLIEKAYEDILAVKDSDKEKYELYREHIGYERLGINYLLCTLWGGSLSDEDYEKYRLEFVNDANESQDTEAMNSGLLKG